MQNEVAEEILYQITTELQVYLTFSTLALVNDISVKPYNKPLIDLARSVCTSEVSNLCFCTDLNALRSSRSGFKNIESIIKVRIEYCVDSFNYSKVKSSKLCNCRD